MKLIRIYGHWNDNDHNQLYGDLCAIMYGEDRGEEALDESLFYYFDNDEDVIGKHFDFTVTSYEEVSLRESK